METVIHWMVLPSGTLIIFLTVRWGVIPLLEKYFNSFKELKDFQEESGCHPVQIEGHQDKVPTDWSFRLRK